METRRTETGAEQDYRLEITPAMLGELRRALGQSLSEFGLTLKRALEPGAERGFSRQYVSGLERGDPKFRITREIEGAFWNLAAALDDVPAAVGGAVPVKLLAQPGQVPEGALVKRSLRAKRCARPGCSVVFIGPGVYHDPECAAAWARERRKLARESKRRKDE